MSPWRTVYVGSKRHPEGQGKEWVHKKKEQARNRGKETQNDSKYTGRGLHSSTFQLNLSRF